MTIEVNNSNPTPKLQRDVDLERSQAQEEARAGREARPAEADESGARADSVELSRDAHSLQRLQERLERQESFDQERVDAIKSAIERGDYPIDTDRLARNFLHLEQALNQ